VAINDEVRSVTSGRRDNHVSVETLLKSDKYLSAEQLVVKATGLAAWNVFTSSDCRDRSRNPVGQAMINKYNVATAIGGRPIRATAIGEVHVPTCSKTTFVRHGLSFWKSCPELREATTKAKAIVHNRGVRGGQQL
jgi:hypothetical protein